MVEQGEVVAGDGSSNKFGVDADGGGVLAVWRVIQETLNAPKQLVIG